MNMRINKLGSHDIAGIIRSDIVKGKLTHNTRLASERSLADIYNVSRGTIRAAMHQLATENLVNIKAGSGIYVNNPHSENQQLFSEDAKPLEIIDTRFAFEPHICRLVVLNASQNELAEAERLLAIMELHSQNTHEFVNADAALRTFLAQITGNTLLIRIISQINATQHQKSWVALLSRVLTYQTMDEHISQYRAIITAIRDRSPNQAAILMKNHLESLRLLITRAVVT